MFASILFATLVAIAPAGPSPGPSPSAAPALQEIAHVHSSACQTLVSHANVGIDAAMQNDVALNHTIRALKTSHLNGNETDRNNSLQELEALSKDIDQRATAGNKEVKELRRIADGTTDPVKKQELLAFANALGGAMYRQYKMAGDLNGFVSNLEGRVVVRSDDPFAPTNVTPGFPDVSSGVMVNGQPINSGGFGSNQSVVGPGGIQRLLPSDDDALANSMADAFISEIPNVTNDEATAASHADGATSGC